MKNIKHRIRNLFSILILGAALTTTSCSWLFSSSIDDDDEPELLTDGKMATLYIKVSSSIKNGGRTINASDFVRNEFTDINLTGKYYASNEEETLLEADKLTELASSVTVNSGAWDFTITAKYNGIAFSDTKTYSVKAEGTNKITFTLKAAEEYGGCEINFTFAQDTVSKAEVTLQNVKSNTTIVNKQELTVTTENGNKVCSFARSPASETERLASGTYLVSFDFYGSDNIFLNHYESYMAIQAGRISKADIALDLNKIFTITYDYDEGEKLSGVEVTSYSRYSSFDLPVAKKDGHIFKGWKDGSNVTITKIDSSNYGNKTLVAEYIETKVYVSGTGDDTTGDGSFSNPFETIEEACNLIINEGTPDAEWSIYIMGDVTGKHSSDIKAGYRRTGAQVSSDYGRSIIPAELTLEHAKSILLTGYHELDADGIPQDLINRGIVGNSTSTSDTGNVLAIATEVPVTIKNVMLTRGDNSSTNPNSNNDPYYTSGGGLNVAAGATVILDDGVLIIKNKATRGGAIYNAGTLYMVGSATIGNKNATTYATNYVTDSTDPCSNEYNLGGGIYNIGIVYLGTNEKSLTGGIYYSYGLTATGGGIYNNQDGIIEMHSGKIAYNDGAANGGGIYLKSGILTMKGGSIYGNSTGGNAGGVYVDNDATFIFAGGEIYGNNANSYGGGVFISSSTGTAGKMFMYGDAVVGNKNKTSSPTATTAAEAMTEGSNTAVAGAGIYAQGNLYLGYKNEEETETLSGGIFYNYSKGTGSTGKGGGVNIYPNSSCQTYMNSGTIAYNYAPIGAAVYVYGPFHLSGSPSIPVGDDSKQDIYLYNQYNAYLYIDGKLDDSFTVTITPTYYELNGKGKALTLTEGANTDLDSECTKFKVNKQVQAEAGIETEWHIATDGYITRNIGAFSFQTEIKHDAFLDISLSGKDTATSNTIYSGSRDVPIGHGVKIEPSNTPSNFSNYVWNVDGTILEYDETTLISTNITGASLSGTKTDGTKLNYILTIDTTGWAPGFHDITVDAINLKGKHVTALFQLKLVPAN